MRKIDNCNCYLEQKDIFAMSNRQFQLNSNYIFFKNTETHKYKQFIIYMQVFIYNKTSNNFGLVYMQYHIEHAGL